MLYELFIVGSLGFWILLGVEAIIMLVAAKVENMVLSIISLLLAASAVWCFGNFNVFTWAWQHPGVFGMYLAAYFVVGTFWAVAKWWFYVGDMKERYDEKLGEFKKRRSINGPIPANMKSEFFDFLRGSYGGSYFDAFDYPNIVPQAKDHRKGIISWIAHWPFSVLLAIFEDAVRKICTAIYRQIAALLQKIANRAFRNVENDFAPVEPPKPVLTTDSGSFHDRRIGR